MLDLTGEQWFLVRAGIVYAFLSFLFAAEWTRQRYNPSGWFHEVARKCPGLAARYPNMGDVFSDFIFLFVTAPFVAVITIVMLLLAIICDSVAWVYKRTAPWFINTFIMPWPPADDDESEPTRADERPIVGTQTSVDDGRMTDLEKRLTSIEQTSSSTIRQLQSHTQRIDGLSEHMSSHARSMTEFTERLDELEARQDDVDMATDDIEEWKNYVASTIDDAEDNTEQINDLQKKVDENCAKWERLSVNTEECLEAMSGKIASLEDRVSPTEASAEQTPVEKISDPKPRCPKCQVKLCRISNKQHFLNGAFSHYCGSCGKNLHRDIECPRCTYLNHRRNTSCMNCNRPLDDVHVRVNAEHTKGGGE